MRIGIDIRWIFEELSGVGVYTRELLRHLLCLDTENEYVLFFDNATVRDRTLGELDAGDNITTVMLPYGLFSPLNQIACPVALRRAGLDVFHSTNYMMPIYGFPAGRRGRIACVVTVHDVIPLMFPDYTPRSRKNRLFAVYRHIMREVGRRADIIITDSESARNDVIRELAIPASRAPQVRAVYCGVADHYQPAATANRDPDKTARILFVGRPDPYKNLEGLVRAFAKARNAGARPMRLVVAGSPDARYPEAPRLALELGVADAVEWTGYLSDKDLVATYQTADLLVLPSRCEGFGLPAIEAMACGTPVICSTAGPLPEVTGDAALHVDPDDIDGLAGAIQRVLENSALADTLRAKGVARAARYTWENAARTTLEIYEDANRFAK